MATEIEILDYSDRVIRITTTEDFGDSYSNDILKGTLSMENHATDANLLVVRYYDYNTSNSRQSATIDYSNVVTRTIASRDELREYLIEFEGRQQSPTTQHYRNFLYMGE